MVSVPHEVEFPFWVLTHELKAEWPDSTPTTHSFPPSSSRVCMHDLGMMDSVYVRYSASHFTALPTQTTSESSILPTQATANPVQTPLPTISSPIAPTQTTFSKTRTPIFYYYFPTYANCLITLFILNFLRSNYTQLLHIPLYLWLTPPRWFPWQQVLQ